MYCESTYQLKFFEAYRAELMLCEAAKHYLEANYIGHELPLTAWKEKREKLTTENWKMYHEYNTLRAQV